MGNELESQTSSQERPPGNFFTKREKWLIVTLISYAALFSPLTSNTYLPALPTLAKAFRKPIELINLTVTMYIVMQGIAPVALGPLSDRLGRRPAFCLCLAMLFFTCVGLAFVPTNAYWLLMVLRCLQATGSASTITIGAGVISDISTAEERGGFFGFFILGPMIGPSIGPVIGGVLTSKFGWRSIFWFLCIAASFCLLIVILFLPETLPALVGNGALHRPCLYRPIIPVIGLRTDLSTSRRFSVPQASRKVFSNPLRLLVYIDIIILLGLNGLVCAVFYGFATTLSTLFVAAYPFLNQTDVGLCFLAIGGGMAIGTSLNGKLLDWDYARISKSIGSARDKFPIEKARLRTLPYLILVLCACCMGYGWGIEERISIAVLLFIHFLVGYAAIAVMGSTQTLMIDLFPGQGSSITACNNLIRCSLSAFLVSVIELIIASIGVRWTFVLLGGISLLVLPLLYMEMHFGPKYRERRCQASS